MMGTNQMEYYWPIEYFSWMNSKTVHGVRVKGFEKQPGTWTEVVTTLVIQKFVFLSILVYSAN